MGTEQHNHTHLYIILCLLVVFGSVFFFFNVPRGPEAPTTTKVDNTTPLELRRIFLSQAQIDANKADFTSPTTTGRFTPTKKEQDAAKKALADPMLTSRLNK
jgi:hypothetical protein